MSLMSTRSSQFLKLLIKHNINRDSSRCLSSVCCKAVIKNRTKNTNSQARLLDNEWPLRKWEITSYRYFADYPEHKKVSLPALSPTMERGTVVSWAKKEGDKLNEGDLLAEIETDKATMGFETPEEGYLAKIVIPAGTKDIPVGKLVCIIVENKEDIAKFKDFKDDSPPGTAAAPAPAPPTPTPPTRTPAAPGAPPPQVKSEPVSLTEKGRIYASPMAKNLAAIKGIRLEEIQQGSGAFGSITSKDLEGAQPHQPAAAAAAPKPAPGVSFIDIPVSNIRAVIARRLLESKTTIPHYYLNQDICVDELMKLRSRLNKDLEKQKVRLSVNDFIIKATAMASVKIPEANSYWLGNVIRQFNDVDVSVAVSTDRGLITPIIFGADRKGLIEISKNMKALAIKARDGKLQPQEFQGGSISISNLGMFGVTHFSAIINPPQSVIVAVGTTQDRIVPVNGEGVAKQFITFTLSCDHRVVDGAVGAQWLKAFKEMLETPVKMLL